MRSVNSAIDGLRPSGTFLEGMFASVAEAAAGFGREVLNVAEVALGVLLRDAIDFIIGQLKDLAQAVLDAGNEFQLLQIRLNSLNLPANASDIKDWSSAMATAKDLTKEQLTWIQQLAAATPFDPATIANVYTMARVFGETDAEARRLTKDITDFGAGQALSNQDLTTTIQNCVHQGLRELLRGRKEAQHFLDDAGDGLPQIGRRIHQGGPFIGLDHVALGVECYKFVRERRHSFAKDIEDRDSYVKAKDTGSDFLDVIHGRH